MEPRAKRTAAMRSCEEANRSDDVSSSPVSELASTAPSSTPPSVMGVAVPTANGLLAADAPPCVRFLVV